MYDLNCPVACIAIAKAGLLAKDSCCLWGSVAETHRWGLTCFFTQLSFFSGPWGVCCNSFIDFSVSGTESSTLLGNQ